MTYAGPALLSFSGTPAMPGSLFGFMKTATVPDQRRDTETCADDFGMTSRRAATLLVLLLVALAGCQNTAGPSGTAPGNSSRLRVVATVGMVADLVREVGGDRIDVTQLMGPGVDPHLYKATRDDVQQIKSADIVFSCGLMLEGRMEDTLEKVGETQPVFAITDKLSHEQLLTPDGASGHPDPHVWMDVAAWASCLDVVVEALSTSDPDGAEQFRSRADSLRQTLQTLHEYGQASIASIPAERRLLVTSHDAFHYFGRAYGLEVIGVQGLSTESEAGLQRINELVDLLVERKVAAVFVESSVPQKNIVALIDGAKSRGHEVRIGGELFSDAMGAEGTWEGTYVGMLDHNITTVTIALGGSAPVRGFSGQLSIPEASP
jgi:manganese/zinc/iron transport system substrate-binding protein